MAGRGRGELEEGRESWARQVHSGGDLDLHLKRRGMRGLGQKKKLYSMFEGLLWLESRRQELNVLRNTHNYSSCKTERAVPHQEVTLS